MLQAIYIAFAFTLLPMLSVGLWFSFRNRIAPGGWIEIVAIAASLATSFLTLFASGGYFVGRLAIIAALYGIVMAIFLGAPAYAKSISNAIGVNIETNRAQSLSLMYIVAISLVLACVFQYGWVWSFQANPSLLEVFVQGATYVPAVFLFCVLLGKEWISEENKIHSIATLASIPFLTATLDVLAFYAFRDYTPSMYGVPGTIIGSITAVLAIVWTATFFGFSKDLKKKIGALTLFVWTIVVLTLL